MKNKEYTEYINEIIINKSEMDEFEKEKQTCFLSSIWCNFSNIQKC